MIAFVFVLTLFCASATAALVSVTPAEKCAMSGASVAVPVPLTAIVRWSALEEGGTGGFGGVIGGAGVAVCANAVPPSIAAAMRATARMIATIAVQRTMGNRMTLPPTHDEPNPTLWEYRGNVAARGEVPSS